MKVHPDGDLKNPRVIVLGMRPAKEEKKRGRPFVGPSGKRLEDYLGVPRCSNERSDRHILVTNVSGMSLPWRDTYNSLPKKDRTIMVLGKIAWRSFQKFYWANRSALASWRVIPCTHTSPKNRLPEALRAEWRKARKIAGL
ncbi:MAG: uracil-DNA glycosylase family protein [Elusimicrobia bacterium]|nr:uracil-DNA glycosylase family protein [Elusimicrobiota bacterium]